MNLKSRPALITATLRRLEQPIPEARNIRPPPPDLGRMCRCNGFELDEAQCGDQKSDLSVDAQQQSWAGTCPAAVPCDAQQMPRQLNLLAGSHRRIDRRRFTLHALPPERHIREAEITEQERQILDAPQRTTSCFWVPRRCANLQRAFRHALIQVSHMRHDAQRLLCLGRDHRCCSGHAGTSTGSFAVDSVAGSLAAYRPSFRAIGPKPMN